MQLIERVVGDRVDLAVAAILGDTVDGPGETANAEWDALPDEQRENIAQEAKRTVAAAIRDAVIAIAAAKTLLGHDAADVADLDPEVLALVAVALHSTRNVRTVRAAELAHAVNGGPDHTGG